MWKGLTWGWVWGGGGGGLGGMGLIYFLALLCHVTAELFKCWLFCLHFRNGGGGGVNLRKALVTFVLFFGMELLWDDINHISKDRICWIAPKVIFQGRKGQIWPLLYLEAILLKNCLNSNFFFYFCIELPRNELSKDDFAWNRSKCPFSRSDLALFTYLSMLFSSTKVLPNCLAPCSFIGVMAILS